MDQARIRESAAAAKIVRLADYRRTVSPDDNGDPPHSPPPAAARRPVPPHAINMLVLPYFRDRRPNRSAGCPN
jgi:hypothetical protein